jgi:hypothetical protein
VEDSSQGGDSTVAGKGSPERILKVACGTGRNLTRMGFTKFL